MIRLLSFAMLIACVALFTPALAQEGDDGVRADAPPMPKTLVIGYEDEGKTDASLEACRVFVKETVEWEEAEMEKAAKDVCAVRKKHVDAYTAFQAAYAKFRASLQQQIRFDGGQAAKGLGAIVKNCIDMKWALSTGGHNIGIDMVPNDIAASCLDLGRDVVVKETTRLNIDMPQPKAGN